MASGWEILWTVLAFAAVVAGGGLLALAAGWGLPLRQRLLPMPRFVPCPWTGGEVLLLFLGVAVLPSLSLQLLHQAGVFGALYQHPVSNARLSLWASPLTLVLFVGLTLTMLWYGRGARPSILGLGKERWRFHVVLGWLAFLVLTLLTYLLLVVSVLTLPQRDHPFQEIAGEGLDPMEIGLMVFQAVVAAPIMEEILFRGILLKWLSRASLPGFLMLGAFTLFTSVGPLVSVMSQDEGPTPAWGTLLGPIVLAGLLVGVFALLLVRTWRDLKPHWEFLQATLPPPEPLPHDDDPDPGPPPMPTWLIFSLPAPPPPNQVRLMLWGQAMLFAIFHAPAWPSPIPLFALALGLGWLTLRSNSLWPAIIAHGLFNAVGMVTLVLGPQGLPLGPIHEWVQKGAGA